MNTYLSNKEIIAVVNIVGVIKEGNGLVNAFTLLKLNTTHEDLLAIATTYEKTRLEKALKHCELVDGQPKVNAETGGYFFKEDKEAQKCKKELEELADKRIPVTIKLPLDYDDLKEIKISSNVFEFLRIITIGQEREA